MRILVAGCFPYSSSILSTVLDRLQEIDIATYSKPLVHLILPLPQLHVGEYLGGISSRMYEEDQSQVLECIYCILLELQENCCLAASLYSIVLVIPRRVRPCSRIAKGDYL